MAKRIEKGGTMLFGRRTYEQFASYWPHQPDDNPYAAVLNNRRKYVVSTTLERPAPVGQLHAAEGRRGGGRG